MMLGYSTNEAEGAIPNGSLVEKVAGDPDDVHRLGSRATVVGSIDTKEVPEFEDEFCYFVEWEDTKGIPVFVSGHKIAPVDAEGE